jgi:hypothetical protein
MDRLIQFLHWPAEQIEVGFLQACGAGLLALAFCLIKKNRNLGTGSLGSLAFRYLRFAYGTVVAAYGTAWVPTPNKETPIV